MQLGGRVPNPSARFRAEKEQHGWRAPNPVCGRSLMSSSGYTEVFNRPYRLSWNIYTLQYDGGRTLGLLYLHCLMRLATNSEDT